MVSMSGKQKNRNSNFSFFASMTLVICALALWNGVGFVLSGTSYDHIYRGMVIQDAFTLASYFPGVVMSLSARQGQGMDQLCFTLGQSVSHLTKLSQVESLFIGADLSYSTSRECLMSNDTCIHNVSLPLSPCLAEGAAGLVLGAEMLSSWAIREIVASVQYYHESRLLQNLTRVMSELKSILNRRLLISDETLPLASLLAPVTCSSAILPTVHPSVTSVASLGSLFAVYGFRWLWLHVNCDSVDSTEWISDFVASAANSLQLDACTGALLPSSLSYLTGHTVAPPSLDPCLSATPVPLPSFSPVSNRSTINDFSGIISVDPLLPTVSSTSPIPATCPPAPISGECEELPSSNCDQFNGCWINWGPCQSVYRGFYSPVGTLDQIPCPPIGSDMTYIDGFRDFSCRAKCVDDRKTVIGGECRWIPPGNVRVDCPHAADDVIAMCERIDRFVFTQFNSCAGRVPVAATGDPMPSPPSDLTVQTWVNVNTRSMAVGGEGSVTPLFGTFGSVMIALECVNVSVAIIVFATASLVVRSDPIPHFRNEWNHVAAVFNASGGSVNFIVNGGSVCDVAAVTIGNGHMPIETVFVEEVASQYETFANVVHYGPFVINASELALTDSGIFALYTTSSPVAIQLFNPTITDRATDPRDIGFYGIAPEGVRNVVDLRTRSFTLSVCDDGNYCVDRPATCFPRCSDVQVFNPFTCACELPPTTSTSTTTTTSSSTSRVATSLTTWVSQSDDPTTGLTGLTTMTTTAITTTGASVGSPAVLILSLLGVASVVTAGIVWVTRRRRTAKVRARSPIHPIDSIDWIQPTGIVYNSDDPFANITTLDWDSNSY